MRIFLWLLFGLFVLKVVAASPRFSRQVDFDSYNTVDYDEREDNFEDNYDYREMTVEDPEVRGFNCAQAFTICINTLAFI